MEISSDTIDNNEGNHLVIIERLPVIASNYM